MPGERDAVRDLVELRDKAEQARQQIGADVATDMQADEVWTSSFGRTWGASLTRKHAELLSRSWAGTAGRSITPGRRRAGSADPADANSRLGIPHSCARKVRAKTPGRYVENRAHGHAGHIESHFRFDQPDVRRWMLLARRKACLTEGCWMPREDSNLN